jgi:hypothetical protein
MYGHRFQIKWDYKYSFIVERRTLDTILYEFVGNDVPL